MVGCLLVTGKLVKKSRMGRGLRACAWWRLWHVVGGEIRVRCCTVDTYLVGRQ